MLSWPQSQGASNETGRFGINQRNVFTELWFSTGKGALRDFNLIG